MIKPEIEQEFNNVIIPLLTEAPKDSFGEQVSEEVIVEVETLLRTEIPDAFKLFLMRYGYADWPDYIFGVGDYVPTWCDLIQNTLYLRNEIDVKMPSHLLPFSPDGWGNYYCFSSEQISSTTDPAVYFWSHETGHHIPTDFGDFFEWLTWMVTDLGDD